jgi:NADH:ubiquinone oxidoreductase subunit 4 (subunit M)
MILIWLIGILLLAGVLAWLAASWSEPLSRWISLVAIGLDFVLAANLWIGRASRGTQLWLDELDWSWIPSFGSCSVSLSPSR